MVAQGVGLDHSRGVKRVTGEVGPGYHGVQLLGGQERRLRPRERRQNRPEVDEHLRMTTAAILECLVPGLESRQETTYTGP